MITVRRSTQHDVAAETDPTYPLAKRVVLGMLLLIVAIVAALIAFALLKRLAAPLILVLIAGYVVHLLHGDRAPPAAVPTPVAFAAPPAQMPENERSVCSKYQSAATAFKPLQDQWNANNDPNGIVKEQHYNRLKSGINAVWADRNRFILHQFSGPTPNVQGWLVVISKVDTDQRSYGGVTKGYIEISGTIDCGMPVRFESQPIEAKPDVSEGLSHIRIGSVYRVNGRLLGHDADHQSEEDAIQWGGILWGPFGRLWGDDAFNKPALHIEIGNVEDTLPR